jgi:hypothetical protein
MLWLSKYRILKEDSIFELERMAHELEQQGMPNEDAEFRAYQIYKQKSLINGAVFHSKSFRHFEYIDPKQASVHRAILTLYATLGIDISQMLFKPFDFDVENLPVGPVNHESDGFVLSFGN